MKVFIGDVKKEMGLTSQEFLEETHAPLSFAHETIPFAQPVRVHLTVTNCGSGLLLEGTIKTALVLSCSRCLEPYIHELKIPFRLEYRNLDRVTRPSDFEAEARDADDMNYYHEEDSTIDITSGVIEAILLHYPMKPLCQENCQGLCPVCGKNLNQGICECTNIHIDPRLTVLNKVNLK